MCISPQQEPKQEEAASNKLLDKIKKPVMLVCGFTTKATNDCWRGFFLFFNERQRSADFRMHGITYC